MEYCNGDSSTMYGCLRAERGHPKPYGVQFWSLGNEFDYGHMEGDNTPGGYCQTALENGRKMLEVSPNLSLCSSGPTPIRSGPSSLFVIALACHFQAVDEGML